MTREKETFSKKKKKLEHCEDEFYAVILKNGAMCLAANADIDTEPETNDQAVLVAEDVKEYQALKLSH